MSAGGPRTPDASLDTIREHKCTRRLSDPAGMAKPKIGASPRSSMFAAGKIFIANVMTEAYFLDNPVKAC